MNDCHSADAIMILYDLKSSKDLQNWITKSKHHSQKAEIILCRSKEDLSGDYFGEHIDDDGNFFVDQQIICDYPHWFVSSKAMFNYVTPLLYIMRTLSKNLNLAWEAE